MAEQSTVLLSKLLLLLNLRSPTRIKKARRFRFVLPQAFRRMQEVLEDETHEAIKTEATTLAATTLAAHRKSRSMGRTSVGRPPLTGFCPVARVNYIAEVASCCFRAARLVRCIHAVRHALRGRDL